METKELNQIERILSDVELLQLYNNSITMKQFKNQDSCYSYNNREYCKDLDENKRVYRCQTCTICKKSNLGYKYLSEQGFSYYEYEQKFELTNELIETMFALGFDYSRVFKDINTRFTNNFTFIIWCSYSMIECCEYGQVRIIDLVRHALKMCPIINMNDQMDIGSNTIIGYTALHYAVLAGNEEFIQILLDNHIDKNIKSAEGVLAIDLAKTENIYKLLS